MVERKLHIYASIRGPFIEDLKYSPPKKVMDLQVRIQMTDWTGVSHIVYYPTNIWEIDL